MVLDNFSPHTNREMLAWVARHDIELVYLPTDASWLHLIECQFQALRRFSSTAPTTGAKPSRNGRSRLPALARPECLAGQGWHIEAEVHHSLPNVAA